MFLYRNVGTRERPEFRGPEPLLADGKALKVPWSAAPLVIDWDGDGRPDLLVGQEPGGIVHYYQNTGTGRQPELHHRGTLQADGREIVMPFEPCPEAPGVFKQDYVGVPEVCDWNGDGRPDLLLGGYVTGRIYYYENTGSHPDGTPVLAARGPLEADGKPIDVSWAATPAVADIDGDGLLELVTGSMFMSATGGEVPAPGRPGLFLFKNVGTRTAPRLHEVPFPLEGRWEENYFLNPRFVDWDGDGLLDLVVGVMSYVVIYRNVGSRTEPRFRRERVLRVPWVPVDAHPDWIGDWDGSGGLDMLTALGGSDVTVRHCTRRQNPPLFERSETVRTAAGNQMVPPARHGDPWGAVTAVDFAGSGLFDLIVGDVAGYVWRYANTGTRAKPVYAEGRRLELADGSPLLAGIDPNAPVTDFTVLQGSRAVPACADFNGDGKIDLVVGDAVGGVTYFENLGDNHNPRFAPGRLIGRLPGRVHVAAGDMNGDGVPDLIVASSGANEGKQVMICEVTRAEGKVDFHFPGRTLPLCWVPYPQPSIIDLSGDGEPDIVLASSYGVVYWVEHSFIRHGYAEGEVIERERRP